MSVQIANNLGDARGNRTLNTVQRTLRVITAAQTLTADNVSVGCEAVLFW